MSYRYWDETGKLTKAGVQEINQAVQNRACPSCGVRAQWASYEGLSGLPSITPALSDERGVVAVALTCRNCAYLLLLDAEFVFPREKR